MLTISKPLSSKQALSYHKSEFTNARQNYYSDAERVLGEWQGQLAVAWELGRSVQEEQFARLAEGQHPVTGDQLVQHRKSFTYESSTGGTVTSMEHRAGWDATFSAPKSVSLTALVGNDERVRAAHRESVTVALNELEKYVQARIGGNVPPETTGKLIAAKFEHDAARPVDGYAAPQLHTHAVIFNVTERESGETRAIQEKELFRSQQYATAVYQSELAIRLRSLGYQIEPGKNHAPEIKGYSQEYLDASSPRSQQIKEHLAVYGFDGAGPAQIAALRTREAKASIDPEQSLLLHRRIAAHYGNPAERIVAEARGRTAEMRLHPDKPKTAQEAVTFARDKLFEREAVNDQRELMREALRRGMGSTTVDEVQHNLHRRLDAGEFIDLHRRDFSPSKELTTRQTLAEERSIIAQMRAGQGKAKPILSRDEAQRLHLRHGRLNADQRNAAEMVLTNRDRIVGIQGVAGAGKTTALDAIHLEAQKHRYEVAGFAPTSRATKQLEEAGIPATTLQARLIQGASTDGQRHLYFLDESSLASTRQINEFLKRLDPEDRVVLVGDTRQHQGVEAGRPFEQLQQFGMQTARLDQIIRQKEAELRTVVEHLARGQVTEAIGQLISQGRVHEIVDPEKRLHAIADDYVRSPEKTLVITPDNESRRALNAIIHRQLQQNSNVDERDHAVKILSPRQELTGADRKWAARYEVGDMVRYQRGSREIGIDKGEYVRVAAVDPAKNLLTVERKDGSYITYDPIRLRGVTVYRDLDRHFSVGDRIQFTAPSKENGIANRELGTITRLQENGHAALRMDSGKNVEIALASFRHIDHGYAVTSHSSQGATTDRVLLHINLDQGHKNLVNARLAYVGLSRARHDVQIYTSNLPQLGQRLGQEVSKTTALNKNFRNDSEPVMARQIG